MKKILFIGAIALAACLAFSSCGNHVNSDDVKAFKEAKDCDAKIKVVEGWVKDGKDDKMTEDVSKEFEEALKEVDPFCLEKITTAVKKLGGDKNDGDKKGEKKE